MEPCKSNCKSILVVSSASNRLKQTPKTPIYLLRYIAPFLVIRAVTNFILTILYLQLALAQRKYTALIIALFTGFPIVIACAGLVKVGFEKDWFQVEDPIDNLMRNETQQYNSGSYPSSGSRSNGQVFVASTSKWELDKSVLDFGLDNCSQEWQYVSSNDINTVLLPSPHAHSLLKTETRVDQIVVIISIKYVSTTSISEGFSSPKHLLSVGKEGGRISDSSFISAGIGESLDFHKVKLAPY
jgi:hypothetical protein